MGIIDKAAEEEQRLQEFRQKFPCVDCEFGAICKHKDTVKIFEIPDFFIMNITCTHKGKLEELAKNLVKSGEIDDISKKS